MKALVPLAILAATLTGCSTEHPHAGASGSPSAPASHSATPSVTPTPSSTLRSTSDDESGDDESITDTTVAKVLVHPYELDLANAEGQIFDAIAFGENPANVAARLQAIFGVAPVKTVDAGNTPTKYDFGGLSLVEFYLSSPYMNRRYSVDVTAGSIGGVAIETVNGWYVGGPTGSMEDTYQSYRSGGVLTVGIELTADEHNNLLIRANDPYSAITEFILPQGA